MSVLSQSDQGAVKLLAIDTACAACSAALWVDGAVVSACLREMARGQAEALMPMVADVMREARIDFAALEAVAVTIGPGSFTGLRTGLAAARGLARAWGLPVIGVTTTEAVALAAHRLAPDGARGRPITVVLNSRRDDLYVQRFTAAPAPIGEPYTAVPEEVVRAARGSAVLFAGDAVDRLADSVEAGTNGRDVSCFTIGAPDATFIAEIGASRWSGHAVDINSFADKLLYLRAPEVRPPAEQKRLRL